MFFNEKTSIAKIVILESYSSNICAIIGEKKCVYSHSNNYYKIRIDDQADQMSGVKFVKNKRKNTNYRPSNQ